MAVFIYELRLAKSDPSALNSEEIDIINEHFNYLKMLVREGRVLLAGRCRDIAFGIVLFRAEALCEAEVIMKEDPAVAKQVMTATCHPFEIALIGDPEEFLAHS